MYISRFLIVLICIGATQSFAQQPVSPLVESFNNYQEMKQKTEFGTEWINVSPVVNSARVESVQLDPTKPGTMYVAFGSGNLWKTTNNGVTWKPIFENQSSHGIGDIALAPSDPNVIYLGTGESLKKGRNFTIPGTGVFRSDNGGETWQHLGLDDSWHIGEIAVHPRNPDVALVAVLGHFWTSNPNRGLFRTADGGKTWNHVLRIDDKTGANDVVWAKDNPDVVYASTWENYPNVSGSNSSVHKSVDGGATWEKCDQGLPTGDQIGRIGLAVSQTNHNKIYALVDNRARIQEGAAQVFKSIDGGQSWEKSHKEDLLFFSRIGWYFADIYVNPKDDEEIFGLGVRVAHSTDGGKSFEYLSGQVAHINPSAASGLHLDHCEMWINPTNPKHIVLGNDGGLYQSYDKGKTWLHYNNLPTGEFYDIEVDQKTGTVFAGAQDDATVYGPAKEWNPLGTDPWKYLWIDPWNGGDGCITLVDPSDSNRVYFSAQEGAFRRKEMTTNRAKGIRPRLPKGHKGKLNFNFVGPMAISPHNSDRLYIAGNYIFQSENRGDDWKVISPDLAGPKEGPRSSFAISAIAESPLVEGLIYAGGDKGTFWVSENGGQDWEDRTDKFPIGYVRNIVPSKYDPNRAYVSLSGLNYDDFASYIYYTEDRGRTWVSISSNLPKEPANVVIEDSNHENILFAGTFRGVYISMNRGKSWSLLGNNMAICSIADLEIYEAHNELIVGTHGRGVYKLNLGPIYEYLRNKKTIEKSNYLFTIPTAKRPYTSDTRPGLNFKSFEKTPITYWLRKGGKAKLSVYPGSTSKEDSAADANRKAAKANSAPIVSFELTGIEGINQFRWDLVIKSQKSSAPYFINYKRFLNPGRYRIQLEVDGTVSEKELVVVDDSKARE